jgi:serine/threonine-protein kinase
MVGAPGPGERLSGYVIGGVIGRGGMGIVYEAEHVALSRQVALKIVAPELATDLSFRERFLREARLAAALDHPAIIPIYDAGEADGVVYIAMRRVHGSDLGALLGTGGPMTAERFLQVMRPVAGALDEAHRRRLVHRDVKPQNILVEPPTPDSPEHVFLTDFGLTKRTDDSGGLTKTGVFVGTFRYAAPEQFQGTDLDGRTDQYALACVAQQCLTGSPPFAGDTDSQVMYGHLAAPPPPITAMRPDLPPGVDEVFRRALAKSRDERFPSCAAFVDALEEAIGGTSAPAPPRTVVAPAPPLPPAPPPAPDFGQVAPLGPTRVASAPFPPPAPGAVPAAPPPAWAPPAGPVAGLPAHPSVGRRRVAWVLVALGAVLAVIGSATSGAVGPALLLFVVPPGAIAFGLSRTVRRGPRIWLGVAAVVAGLWNAGVGLAATVNGAPKAIPLIASGALILIGGIRVLSKPGPPGPG